MVEIFVVIAINARMLVCFCFVGVGEELLLWCENADVFFVYFGGLVV